MKATIDELHKLRIDGQSFTFENASHRIKGHVYASGPSPSWASWTARVAAICRKNFSNNTTIISRLNIAEMRTNALRGTEDFGHAQPVWMGLIRFAIDTYDHASVYLDEAQTIQQKRDPKKIFVVHGRDVELRNSMFNFLRSLKLEPVEWIQAVRETGKGTPYIGEIIDRLFETTNAVVVLMSPDDEGRLIERLRGKAELPHETELTGQARQNVIFEAGMAFGRHPDQTILVEVGALRPYSDAGGRHVIRLTNESTQRQELAERLRTLGCAVDTSGTDWHKAGNFVI
jgi:predicted nucleotide-binding protein